MDPQLLASLKTITENQQITFTTTVGTALVIFLAICFVFWRLAARLDARHAETSKTLSDITAIAQTIAAQNRDVLRRLEP